MLRPHERLASCILAALVALSCGEDPAPRGRVLLVGIDGASLRLAQPLMREGGLPHLLEIAKQGVYGPLRSHAPISSPRIWTSIATGKGPKQHGILSFATEDPEGPKRLYRSSDRKGHALWNIASDSGRRVAVVNWWTTYPVETVNGVMVSDHLLAGEVEGRRKLTGVAESATGPIVHPEEWEERLLALADDSEPLTDVADPFLDVASFPEWALPERLSERYRNDERVMRIALEVERELRPDLMMVFLPGIDRVSHRLWGAFEPPADGSNAGFTLPQRKVAVTALKEYYRFTDALIGKLLAAYGPDDLVLVVSDHGFETGSSMIFLTGDHKTEKAINGVVFARGPDIAIPERRRPTSVNDITPTILAWLGLPLGDDMQGRPAAFLAVDPDEFAHIPTHDTRPIERLGEAPSGAEDAMLDHLRSLGYLEADESE